MRTCWWELSKQSNWTKSVDVFHTAPLTSFNRPFINRYQNISNYTQLNIIIFNYYLYTTKSYWTKLVRLEYRRMAYLNINLSLNNIKVFKVIPGQLLRHILKQFECEKHKQNIIHIKRLDEHPITRILLKAVIV